MTNRKTQITHLITKTIKEAIPNGDYKVFIFGSQANQEQLINADIDIGIESENELDNMVIPNIKFELNESPATLFKFDVVDFSKVSDAFKSVALKNIEVL